MVNERKDVISWLHKCEEKYDVNQWKYEDIHIWPFIRQLFFFSIISPKGGENKNQEILLQNFNLFSLLKFLRLFKTKKSSTVFSLVSHFRNFNPKSKKLENKFFHSLIEKENKNFWIIDHSNKGPIYRNQIDYPSQTLFGIEPKFVALIIRKIFFRKKILKALSDESKFSLLLEEFNKKFDQRLTQQFISKQFLLIYILSRFYKRLFKKNNVQKVYVLCYYLSEMHAMILAANELKIESYDIQHGSQGKLHIAYTDFKTLPENGYFLLPKYFLCWNDFSTQNIKKWTLKSKFHDAILFGNPWHSYVEKNYTDNSGLESKNIFLITLQPLGEELIDRHLLEIIVETVGKVEWLIRLHPRQLHLKVELEKILKDYEILGVVSIEEANSLPLPLLLKKTNLHFSKFSGSIEEAASQNVPTVILHPNGIETYGHLIEEGLAFPFAGGEKEELLNFIVNFISNNKRNNQI